MTQLKYISYETAYNRHIRNARKAATGLHGYERATAIATYFKGTAHPHVNFTFEQMALNRTSDRQFAIELLNTLADLTAKNETGHYLNTENTRWVHAATVGNVSLNGVQVCRYSSNGMDTDRQLITVEHNGHMTHHLIFNDYSDYENWVERIAGDSSGVQLVQAIHQAMED